MFIWALNEFGDNAYSLRIDKGCECEKCKRIVPDQFDREDLAEKIHLMLNASNGMTTEQAVRYLKHGKEAIALLKLVNQIKSYGDVTDFLNRVALMESNPISGICRYEGNCEHRDTDKVSDYCKTCGHFYADMEGK
jgi:hypothetical protein